MTDTKHDYAAALAEIDEWSSDDDRIEFIEKHNDTIRHALKLVEKHERRQTELLQSNNELLERARRAERFKKKLLEPSDGMIRVMEECAIGGADLPCKVMLDEAVTQALKEMEL